MDQCSSAQLACGCMFRALTLHGISRAITRRVLLHLAHWRESDSVDYGSNSEDMVQRYVDFGKRLAAASNMHVYHFDRDAASSNDQCGIPLLASWGSECGKVKQCPARLRLHGPRPGSS